MKAGTSLQRYVGEGAFAGVVLALALATALLAAIGTWACREFQEQASRYSSYRDLQLHAGQADSLSLAYAGLLKNLDELKQALPAQGQSSFVLNLLVETARNMNLGIAGITALDEVPFSGYVELPFELELTGNFKDLVRYIHAFESSGLAVEVRRLSSKSEALNRARIQARLELSVFVPAGSRGKPAAVAATKEKPSADTSHAPASLPVPVSDSIAQGKQP